MAVGVLEVTMKAHECAGCGQTRGLAFRDGKNRRICARCYAKETQDPLPDPPPKLKPKGRRHSLKR